MDCSKSTARSPRRIVASAALGAVLCLSPIMVLSSPSSAQAPATAVTGLARGDRGDSVKAVQQALVTQGIQVAGGVDGIFGAGTEAAVKAFQSRQGLPQSGKIDDATAIALGLVSSPFLGLTQGARGAAVTQLQERLAAAGFRPSGGADGIFGPATTTALSSFQQAKGLSARGTVDAATAAALGAVPASGGVTAPATAGEQATRQPQVGSSSSNASSLVGLKIGSRGDAVKTLQQTIINAGFTVVGGADGIFGVLTANALRSFQNANGLGTTGVVDEATATALAAVGTGSTEAHDPTVTSPLVGLRYGSIGSDVKALQQALIDAGIKVRGGADGVFGEATRSALREFQSAKALEVSGVVDAATAAALSSGGGGGSATPATSALVGLKSGALGNTVKALQQALIDAGVTVRGGADGIFGPATAAALKEFQTSQGLSATGAVDQATAAALAAPKPVGAKNPDGGGDTAGFAVYGEKGTRVIALQTALVNAGISVRGGVDGDFGGGTSAAVMEFQRQKGLRVTGVVDAATATALGLASMPAPTAPDVSKVRLDAFPVQGVCGFADTWLYPRGGGRKHLGVDIIAAEGKLIYAVADGTIEKVYADYPGSLAGNGVRLRLADGTYFFYAHMSSIAEGIDVGVPVKAGQIIGYVGSTGNSGTPHLHFEVHPQGGEAVNPYPLVKAIDGCSITSPLPQP